jgi:hypothetical protein
LTLAVVGVLEFVHEDRAKFGLRLGADAGILDEGFGSKGFKVVKIKALAFTFEMSVFEKSLLEEAINGGEVRGNLLVEEEAGFLGKELEMILVNVTQILHRLADGFDIVPVILLSLRGDGFSERSKGGEGRIPLSRQAGSPDIFPMSKNRLARQFEFVFRGGRAMGIENRNTIKPRLRIQVGCEIRCEHDFKSLPHPSPREASRGEKGVNVQPAAQQRIENLPQFVFLERLEEGGNFSIANRPRQRSVNGFGLQGGGQSFFENFKGGVELCLGRVDTEDFGA